MEDLPSTGSPPAAKRAKLEENVCNKSTEHSANNKETVTSTNNEPEDNVAQNVETVCDNVRSPNAVSAEDQNDNKHDTVCLSVGDEKVVEGDAAEADVTKKAESKQESNIEDGSEEAVSKSVPDRTVMEKDVGIEEYISSYPGFQAVIKQRYSDFLVNEISMDGRVVHLTNTDLPCPVPKGSPQTGNVSTDVISKEDADKLMDLLNSMDAKKSVLIQVGEDKAERAKIHGAIETGFPGLESSTVTKGDNKYIEVKITSNKGNGLQRWPKGRGFYCKFVLYKEAKDTMDAVGILANKLRLKGSLFQYAGTKDKRAKTSQEVTVFKVAAEKLLEANQKLRNIVTGNYSYVSEKLQLGQLQGNKFTIVLRSVTGSEQQIDQGMISLRDVGFINYYGMQRFGVTSIPTHHIGRALLCGNWKEAIEMILKPRPGDEGQISEARDYWWKTRDSKGAMAKFPRYSYIERNILQGLSDQGDNDYMAAINRVARNTRLMYVHAYQSYIWNTLVSHRMRKHGLQLVSGDLVIPRNSTTLIEENDLEQTTVERTKITPVLIDSSNIGDYSIYDIVLPKPGYDVIYPGGDMEVMYKDLMKKDGIDYQNMKTKYKDFSLSGDYRHMIVKPTDVTWKLFRYDDVSIPIALSDWDKINNEPEPQSVEGGANLALRVELTLPSSCYATMALRELLKIDTSSSYQTSLNT